MTCPKMILFDYGHTLLYEPGWDSVRGNEKLLSHAIKRYAEIVFGENIERVRKLGYDISGQVGNRFLYEYLGIEFSLSPLEMETVFWDGASAGAMMPEADKMLDYINQN